VVKTTIVLSSSPVCPAEGGTRGFVLRRAFWGDSCSCLGISRSTPGIVGAFLSGLALNEAAQGTPAAEKLRFFANALFIPFFFIVMGFLINPAVFVRSLIDNFGLTISIVLALVVGKGLAAESTGRAFHYGLGSRLTVWSLTLPQVAATLAAALVGFKTFDPAGVRLIDERLLNAVFVLMLTTSILGPVPTQRFAPLMLQEFGGKDLRGPGKSAA
jgi:Kef-type K+ transport system membrane component KefB